MCAAVLYHILLSKPPVLDQAFVLKASHSGTSW